MHDQATSDLAHPPGGLQEWIPLPAPYPQESRDDVVRVARAHADRTELAQTTKDFGVHQITLHK